MKRLTALFILAVAIAPAALVGCDENEEKRLGNAGDPCECERCCAPGTTCVQPQPGAPGVCVANVP